MHWNECPLQYYNCWHSYLHFGFPGHVRAESKFDPTSIMIKATIKGWGAANCLQILCCWRWQGGDWENRWGIFVLKHNRTDIQLQVWILIGSFWPDIGDIAAKPKRIYQQQQRETTMDGRNCHSVVKKTYLFLKQKHILCHTIATVTLWSENIPLC